MKTEVLAAEAAVKHIVDVGAIGASSRKVRQVF